MHQNAHTPPSLLPLAAEYLEANFYSCAAFGTPIDRALWGDGGMAPTGCVQAQLTPVGMAYAKAIAAVGVDDSTS